MRQPATEKIIWKETQTNIDSLIVQLAQEEWHVYNEVDKSGQLYSKTSFSL